MRVAGESLSHLAVFDLRLIGGGNNRAALVREKAPFLMASCFVVIAIFGTVSATSSRPRTI